MCVCTMVLGCGVHLVCSQSNTILRYTVSETVKACFAFQQERAGLLCTEAIVFVHWQTPNQTMSHAKHSLSSPPTSNSTGWESSLFNTLNQLKIQARFTLTSHCQNRR